MGDPGSWDVGAAPLRREDARFITGRSRFVADISLPGQLHCAFVRSPHAHAQMERVDTREAVGMAGVRAVLTGAEMADDGVGPLRSLWLVRSAGAPSVEPPRWALARDRVRHIGEAVAVVIAQSREAAEDAAERVSVDYTPLPALIDPRQARMVNALPLHKTAPGNRCYTYERGDRAATAAAFSAAAHITRLTLVNQRVAGCALEPRALLAAPAVPAVSAEHGMPCAPGAPGVPATPAPELLTLYSSTQVPHHIQQLLCEELDLAPSAVRVVAPDVGGGFGYKGKHCAEELVLAWAARRLQCPLKWVATRSESFLSDLQGRDHHSEAALALDGDGRFLAIQVDTLVNLGAYVSTMGSAISSVIYTSLLCGMYQIGAMHARVEGVFTNTLPTDAYRGAGRPEACYVLERLVDQAAVELGIARAELRRRNLVPARAVPYTSAAGPVYDSGDFQRVFERALALADYPGFPARRAQATSRGAHLGLGIACFVESSGVGPSKLAQAGGARVALSESATVSVHVDGSVTAVIGTQNHGQGHETVFTQILATRLGLDPARIEIVEGDTGRIAHGTGTFGSRSVAVGGSALLLAAEDLIKSGRQAAARAWGIAIDDVSYTIVDGVGRYVADARSLDTAAISRLIHDPEASGAGSESGGAPAWRGHATFDPQAFAFSNGVHLCEVEVDTNTGIVKVLRYSAVDDVGRVIHPAIVEGQLHGGVAQGLGQALKEACVYDPDTGQLLTGSFLDYALPRSEDAPARFDSENDESQPYRLNPLGAKGAGEAGAIAAPAALVNAVLDALRPLGVTDLEMPLTPARVWAALRAAGAKN